MNNTFFAKQIVRKIFFEDWALKLTALAITLALWFVVTGLSTPTTRRITVPLNLTTASNAQISSSAQQEVEIEISGDKRRIEQINRSELSATVDLTEAPMGDRVVLLEPESVYVPLPQGVKLSEVAPSRIVVALERVEERDLEVRTETKGQLPAGYELYSSLVIPPRVRVRGPESVMRTIEFVKTEKIDITGRKGDFTALQVPVLASQPRAAVLNTVVDVQLRIGEHRIERSFTLPIAGVGKNATFVLYGPRTVLAKMHADDLRVEMSLNDGGEEQPQVILPPDMEELIEVKKVSIR
ncbi:MAG: YbbR-like domain-containing protein [Pyrinomonadaceae bacterium]|nr:YbbR-like domain-containing protein [Pyrinomonadaceae bacterium]